MSPRWLSAVFGCFGEGQRVLQNATDEREKGWNLLVELNGERLNGKVLLHLMIDSIDLMLSLLSTVNFNLVGFLALFFCHRYELPRRP